MSSPQRVYFADRGETKQDTIDYALAVAEGLMRGLRDRPVALHRFPTGAGGKGFYNKRVPADAPDWLPSVAVRFPSARPGRLLCPTSIAHVVWAINRGGFELHPWPVRSPDLDHPTELRIDLDPQPGCPPGRDRDVAHRCRALLQEDGIEAVFPKLSGAKCLHLHVPLAAAPGGVADDDPTTTPTFLAVRHACLALARELAERFPDDVTAAWWKEERGPRVFIDFNQNLRDKTIVAPYAVRPLPHAPVAAPLRFDEVSHADPRDITMATVPARFRAQGDPMAPMDALAETGGGAPLAPLLDRHRHQYDRGLPDAPYPPHYPKQPGEPPRVAPSRAAKTTRGR
ncbi:MAG: ATP-dependent DNA ligase [Myxococcota bacterium]